MASYKCSWKSCNTNSLNPNFGSQFSTNSTNQYLDSYTHYSNNRRDDLRITQKNNSYTFKISYVPVPQGDGTTLTRFMFM